MRINLEGRLSILDEQIATAAERVRKTHIDEREVAVQGVLTGVLTKGRQFEFQVEGSGEIIRGRIASSILDPLTLKPFWDARAVAHLRVVRVERAGKEQRTYSLTGIEAQLPEDGSSKES